MIRFSLIFSILLIGCSSMVIQSDRDPGADLTKLTTFEWVTPPPSHVKNSLLEGRVQKAVEAVLTTKGYKNVTSGTPDFKVTYDALKATHTEIRTYDSHYSMGGVQSYQYDVGTLVLDVMVPSTSKIIWRGWAEAEIPEKMSTEEREKKIHEAVDKMLAKFPSKTVPSSK